MASKYVKGEQKIQEMANVFPVAKTIDVADRMKAGDTVVIIPLEIVDPVKRKVKVRVLEAPGFEADTDVITFMPTALFNLIASDEKIMGESVIVEYEGLVLAKEKNEKTGLKSEYHNFKLFEIKK